MKVVLAEKPSVAKDIANVLGCNERKDGYLNGNDYAVTWAFGHLVTIAGPVDQNPEWENLTLDALPIIPDDWQFEVPQDKKKQFNVIKRLFNDPATDEIICATDAGREGEHIFRLIYQETGCTKPFKRLWISSLTNQAIKDGFQKLYPGSDFDSLAAAAMNRAKADWLVGLNFSIAYSNHNRQKISTGRVQTPTLAMIVQREMEIKNFVKSTFFEVHAAAKAGFTARYINSEGKHALDKEAAENIVNDLDGISTGQVIWKETKETKQKAAPLYNLLNLQKDANSLFGMTAAETLKVAQKLYEKDKLISYPRTESNHISTDMVEGLPEKIKNLPDSYKTSSETALKRLDDGLKLGKAYVDDTKLTDHHAIIPTGNKANLDDLTMNERNVFMLVCEQFISIFLPECITEKTKLDINIEGYVFRASGTVVKDPGWKSALIAKKAKSEKEETLPELSENDPVDFNKIEAKEKETKPPARFNDSTLLTAMKNAGKLVDDKELAGIMKENGIGTPATRAGIIEKLFQIGYCARQKKTIVPTPLGIDRINSEIEQLKSPAMTGEWEQKLKEIENGNYAPEAFYQEIIDFILELMPLVGQSKKIERPNLGKCPSCGKGLVIEGKKGFGCSEWKGGCKFVIWKGIAGKKLTPNNAKQLLEKGKTSLIKGFTSSKGNKFDAFVVLKDGKTEFEFDNSKKKPAGSSSKKRGPRQKKRAFKLSR